MSDHYELKNSDHGRVFERAEIDETTGVVSIWTADGRLKYRGADSGRAAQVRHDFTRVH